MVSINGTRYTEKLALIPSEMCEKIRKVALAYHTIG